MRAENLVRFAESLNVGCDGGAFINGQIIVIAAGLVAMAVLLKTYAAGVLAATAAG